MQSCNHDGGVKGQETQCLFLGTGTVPIYIDIYVSYIDGTHYSIEGRGNMLFYYFKSFSRGILWFNTVALYQFSRETSLVASSVVLYHIA
jgi:hypothetical protein